MDLVIIISSTAGFLVACAVAAGIWVRFEARRPAPTPDRQSEEIVAAMFLMGR